MNSSSKVPPRFVPTLTEVVQSEVDIGAAEDEGGAEGAGRHDLDPDESPGNLVRMSNQPEVPDGGPTAARASFHSPWLADGLYVRSKPATIPHQLPPLPESLPPQQPFAKSASVGEVMSETSASVDMSEQAVDVVEAVETLDLSLSETPKSVAVGALLPLAAEDADLAEPLALAEQEPSAEEATTIAASSEQQLTCSINEEYLIQRLMQRVDRLLEHRLQEAIENVVEIQTRSLALRLREEVESVLRHSVHEAVEAELELQAQQKNEN